MSQFRSPLFCAAFAVGAIAGCLATSLFGPQPTTAAPLDAQGLPFENQQDIAAIKEMLSGITQDDGGKLIFNRPVDFRGGTVMTELLVDCGEDASKPALTVCGKTLLSFPGVPPHAEPLLDVKGPLDVMLPTAHPGPALHTNGPVDVMLPTIHPGPGLVISKPGGATCITPFSVELLVECAPDAELLGGIKTLSDGSTLLQVSGIEAGGVAATELLVETVEAQNVTAETITETGGFPQGPGTEFPNP